MSWLKLTEKSLYLIEGGEYLKKVDLRDYNGERALDIPFDCFVVKAVIFLWWLRSHKAPLIPNPHPSLL